MGYGNYEVYVMEAIIQFLTQYIGQIPTGVFYVFILVMFGVFYRTENKKHDEIKKLLEKHAAIIDKTFEEKSAEHTLFFKKLNEHDECLRKGNIRFENMESNVDRTYMVVLRDTIYNERLVIKDRLAAFKEYKRMGGNGYTDVYYETHLVTLAQAQIESEKLGSFSE